MAGYRGSSNKSHNYRRSHSTVHVTSLGRGDSIIGLIIGGIMLLALGAMVLISGIINQIEREEKLTYYKKTRACIIDYTVDYEWDSDTESYDEYYYPIYQFDYNNNEFIVESSSSSSTVPQIGRIIDILVNPRNPNEYMLANDNSHLTSYIIGAVMATIGITLIIVFIFKKKSKSRFLQEQVNDFDKATYDENIRYTYNKEEGSTKPNINTNNNYNTNNTNASAVYSDVTTQTTPQPVSIKRCPNCHSPIAEDSHSCPYCGNDY